VAKQNQQTVSKLKSWRETMKFRYGEDKESVVPLKFYYNPDTDVIVLEFICGTGASERADKLVFKESVLDDKLALFESFDKVRVIAKEGVIKQRNVELKAENKPTIRLTDNNTKLRLNMSKESEENLKGLRSHLFEAINKLEGGTMNVEQAKSMAQLSQTIINSVKLEMEYKKMLSKNPSVTFLD